ncbi:pyrroloquinoline quinone biosynthesis peptide chaperone PqqD [Gluconacetobacter sp. 1b LMG 1731]|uniref:Pyrroloquinoline quinone biosynthesis peptide chaperone PqqD n=1 Tax=Gluconacetobacter dulcium TaxID=2729096 RepID=A0A7W4JXG6_9PROT|nr:pyrroloquinoline quinone biosynthesis peptide chaperone PqqD [Gluconacetobacter dulcium]MBB2166345.1 pyrroloquinoline quinone biosynthesis peptide chaperone PqqD [Gluconacetobacter dulcium]MBB2195489.1 pyrroloquinoline quinone biosynthesis peptide chaperone PqqD [Gluconacetobacter dulcium]MBB2196499.1 pyrroloquinoline quinone biosynthesis peptide chaperone PqqD [Gluconacetobacter dulcium]
MTGAPTPSPVGEETIVRFLRGTRLHHDRVRDQWVIQAPERAFIADPIAAEILRLVDGTRPVSAIIDTLAERFAAPRPVIAQDVLEMIASLTERQVLTA